MSKENESLAAKTVLYTLIGTGLASLISLGGMGSQVSNEAASQATSDGTPPTPTPVLPDNGRGCINVSFTRDGQRQYVTVPHWDAERIQAEVDAGNHSSIQALEQCGETGFIFAATAVATFAAPEYEAPVMNMAEIRAQLDTKKVGERFFVVRKSNLFRKQETLLVQKISGLQFDIVGEDGGLTGTTVLVRDMIAMK